MSGAIYSFGRTADAARISALLAIPGARKLLADRIDFYIQMLDLMSPDPDLELDVDAEDVDPDDEPELGSLGSTGLFLTPQTSWAKGGREDREADAGDQREDDVDSHEADGVCGSSGTIDDEESLGWRNEGSQETLHQAAGDCEADAGDEGEDRADEDIDAPETHGRGWLDPAVHAEVGRTQA